ncbi:hypothetical protein KXX16_007073 [Aspergillus fumigatus]|nr:hypothetical protein CNMCM8057_005646 [Aspergillus fumigatus]KMK58114.1 hypothetical protein Y699_03534 [Aspergillus fumigatus Z5]KAF4253796.1 hypothetical protein CNMCM8714_005838 [Aspergillus fumigatus]KAF4259612.1 hypothetical protein CNMCM8812_005794 [Aspergillus fumigatus]KAF4281145.1 hypothetical protein CNMCM8689_001064 [Aspergillus fumigatus]
MATATMTSMSTSTTTGTAAASTCTGNRWVLPVQDVACALPATGNYSSIMDKCCSPAAVTKYNDGCGLYCLAQGQSMGDLLDCIKENGGNKDVFCGGQLNATATASLSETASSTATRTGTGASASETRDNGAPTKRVSVLGVGLVAMIVCGMFV